jgi:hypothetical protein
MTGSRNAEADGEGLRSLGVARGTSAEGAGRLRDLEYQRKQRRGRSDADHRSPQFLIVIRRYHIDSISGTNGAMIRRNQEIVENNEITQK